MASPINHPEQQKVEPDNLFAAKFWVPLIALLIGSLLYTRFPFPRARLSSFIISGSFTSSSLYLLRYDHGTKQLEVVRSFAGLGPHQYLFFDRENRRLYATSWDEPAHLSSWSVELDRSGGHPKLTLINKAPITAVSSYITSKYQVLFSVGGPTGELHHLNKNSGRIEEKIQELLFVPAHVLPSEDKTRKALRNGSHGIEISSLDQAFVPHLGHNSIWMYKYDHERKALDFLTEVKSLEPDDGPRHCAVSEDGQRLYVITEHTSRVDLYSVKAEGLVHQASSSVINDPVDRSKYRGDTVRIAPHLLLDPSNELEYIFATTRGSDHTQCGILAVFEYNFKTRTFNNLVRWETPTSGGKANAIEFNLAQKGTNKVDIILTDDELGWVTVLEYGPSRQPTILSRCLLDEKGIGASHAVWIN